MATSLSFCDFAWYSEANWISCLFSWGLSTLSIPFKISSAFFAFSRADFIFSFATKKATSLFSFISCISLADCAAIVSANAIRSSSLIIPSNVSWALTAVVSSRGSSLSAFCSTSDICFKTSAIISSEFSTSSSNKLLMTKRSSAPSITREISCFSGFSSF